MTQLMVADEFAHGTMEKMEKLEIFNAWQPVLESAVSALPEHPDLALLRLGVQNHELAVHPQSGRSQLQPQHPSGHRP